uniref:ER membrane protein complex subunit 7 beta-sandwich domain-containing protein n=1 Tax=Rhodosorus marinus TaxID=101924 RepID=A0A7S0G2K8_9RHOD|mmetsp:Transcript_19397/g.28136  ORF Transcript_19397/g.28136 Transcript_19397/m.28136 type:complete len:212 (+) Transcript_19397:106-741(+)
MLCWRLLLLGFVVAIVSVRSKQQDGDNDTDTLKDLLLRGDGIISSRLDQTYRVSGEPAVVVLTDAFGVERKCSVDTRGGFEFREVGDGVYFITVIRSRRFVRPLRIMVENGRVSEAHELDSSTKTLIPRTNKQDLVLVTRHLIPFIRPKAPFPLASMLKSRYTLLLLVAIVLVFMLPKMMDSMDDDLMQELFGTKKPILLSPNEHIRKLTE